MRLPSMVGDLLTTGGSMEDWMNTLARVAATIQERDRQTGEMVALELLINKNNRLGNQETVDLLLDSLQFFVRIFLETMCRWEEKRCTNGFFPCFGDGLLA